MPQLLKILIPCLMLMIGAAPSPSFSMQSMRQEEKTVNGEPAALISPEQNASNDAAIATRLTDIYQNLPGMEDVKVDVDAGIVRLGGSTLTTQRRDDAADIARRIEGVIAVENEIEEIRAVDKRLELAYSKLRAMLQSAIELIPLIAIALFIIVIFWLAGRWISTRQQPWRRIAPNPFIQQLIRQLVSAGFLFAGILLALDLLGATAFLGTLLGAAGLLGLAVGFAVKDTIENYIASVLLSLRQPFAPNDHVVIDREEGYVVRLTSRATTLLSTSGNHIRIPNAQVFKAVITNFSSHPERRFEFVAGIDTEADIKTAQVLAMRMLKKIDAVLDDPEPLVLVKELGDSNIVLWIAGWMDQRNHEFAKVRSEAIRLIKTTFDQADIAMPEPIYNIRLQSGAAGKIEESITASRPKMLPPSDDASGDTAKSTDFERKVETERAKNDDEEDLLNPGAPRE